MTIARRKTLVVAQIVLVIATRTLRFIYRSILGDHLYGAGLRIRPVVAPVTLGSVEFTEGSLEFAIYYPRDLSGDSRGLAWLKFYGHSLGIYSSRGQNYSTKDYVNINSR